MWIAWAAGIFEGEGSIVWNKTNEAPVLSMCMCDGDVVTKFFEVVGVGTINGPYVQSTKPDMTPIWMWRLSNYQDVTELMEKLTPFLGVRRKARWAEVQEMYKASTKVRRPQAKRTRESTRKLQEV